jgi:hypothetical protein
MGTGPPGWQWVTGQQPVTVIKLTVRKSKLWPQNSRTEWNGPRQWKRVNELKKLNCNVCTLYRAGAMNELEKEMDKYKIEICALQALDGRGKDL